VTDQANLSDVDCSGRHCFYRRKTGEAQMHMPTAILISTEAGIETAVAVAQP